MRGYPIQPLVMDKGVLATHDSRAGIPCEYTVYGNLLEELESRGLVVNKWQIAKPYAPEGSKQWEGDMSRWWESEEIQQWVFDISCEIVEASQQNMESLFTVDPRALARLSSVCGALTVHMDGALSKDLARISWFAANSQESLDFELDEYLRLQICRGRYLDLLGFYQQQFGHSTYDETFAPDIAQLLDEMNAHYEELAGKDPAELSDPVVLEWAKGNTMMLMMMISRGAFLQLEVGLRILSFAKANEFMTIVAPRYSTAWLQYDTPQLEYLSPIHYALSHSMSAYSSVMLSNLTPVTVPDEVILGEADKACMDNHDLTAIEAYHTLFGHIVRLRVLGGLEIEEERWEEAVSQAGQAVDKAATLADVGHNRASAEVIRQLCETRRINDMELYANDHSRYIDSP